MLEESVIVGPRVVLRVDVGEGLDPCYDMNAGGGADGAGVGYCAIGSQLKIEACVGPSRSSKLRGQVEGGRECGGLDCLWM